MEKVNKIMNEQYDEIYDKYNTSVDGYIKKIQLFSFVMSILEIYDPSKY